MKPALNENTSIKDQKPIVWLYKNFSYQCVLNPFSFEISSGKPTPRTLCKYYKLDENSIDALAKSYMYVSHPEQLNDVFDSSEHILDFDDMEINQRILISSPLSETQKQKFLQDEDKISEAAKEIIYSRLGIYSMSDTPDNMLLWAYYTHNKGFAIEFNIEKLKESSTGKIHGPFPINYVEDIEPVSLSRVDYRCAVLMQSNIKQEAWKHENEWRLLVESKDGDYSLPSYPFIHAKERKSYYSIEAVESIWLGAKFFDKEELLFDQETNTWSVILKEKNIKSKSQVLTFITNNNLKIYLWQQDRLNSRSVECQIERICNCCFRIQIQ